MGQAGDDHLVDSQAHLEPGEADGGTFDPRPGRYDERRESLPEPQPSPPDRTAPVALATGATRADLAPGHSSQPAAEAVPLRRRESLAERLERERIQRERVERERRATVERERAERERAERERRERRRHERAEKLRRERQALRSARRPTRSLPARPEPAPAQPSRPKRAQVPPAVSGPVKKRARAAENRRRVAGRRHGLFWPTAKAGFAVTVVMALGAALGSALGLPLPGLDTGPAHESLANSASIFGIDPGTPTGLVRGYVFPVRGPHDFGDELARFGAPRYGHIHEGQDIFGKAGTAEVAVRDGIVVDRGKNSNPDDGGRGNYIAIYSPEDNHSFVYMHMLKPSPVRLGQRVHSGEEVGQLGCTGSCEGPHLHFEVRVGKASLGAETKPLDPLPFLRQWPQSTPG